MQTRGNRLWGKGFASRPLWLPVVLSLFVARDAPARALAAARLATETVLVAGLREERVASWAAALEPIEIASASTRASERIRLYDRAGEIDEPARRAFERVASREPEVHALAPRVEQLVFKAAYHFGADRVVVVSAWRERSGKHTAGEAVDFRLRGVHASKVAAYLRELPRVGVGVYTHPGTQYVHIDIREPSYAWLDASPPGVHWKERSIGDARGSAKRDDTYAPEMDLP
jgi:uncharacterized protein YcbK (DUF882 family)